MYNAYSVARQMASMERHLRQLADSDVIAPAYKDSIETVLGVLVWYANLQDLDENYQLDSLRNKLKGYARLETLYSNLAYKLYSLAFLGKDNWEEAKANILSQLMNPQGHSNAITQLETDTRHFFDLKGKLKTARETLATKEAVHKKFLNDSTRLADSIQELEKLKADYPDSALITTALDNKKTALTSLTSGLPDLTAAIIDRDTALNQLIAEQRRLETHYGSNSLVQQVKLLLAALAKTQTESHAKSLNDPLISIASSQAQYASVKEIQIAAMEQAPLSLRLPTEAQMIDAVAIYLAKRMKQEAVMWFFETIKKNANQYELLKTFFPNTITLLQSNEVYEIPNLGAQWRYALSKDFVKMPRNVLTSKWFATWYDTLKINRNVNTREFLIASYDVCDLICQQYSYQQLVKQMYLNLHSTDAKANPGKVTPANIFSILYAFNQECFIPVKYQNTDTPKTRLMRYEDFRNLGKDELEIMISLMDMKYSQAFGAIWRGTGKTWFLDTKNAEDFRRWAGSIESAIAHFNKVQSDYEKLTAEIKDGKKIDAVYSVFNIWENVNGLINAVIPDTSTRSTTLKAIAKDMQKTKQQLSAAFEIYNQLSLKNYAGAVNSTIALAEELIYDSTFRFKFGKQLQDAIQLTSTTSKSFTAFKGHYGLTDTIRAKSFRQEQLLSAFIFEQDRHAINLIRKLAGFLNDVMLTTDAKQLSKVVESYALPPGSYKRKRNNWWSLDLNAYVGGYYGIEKIEGEYDHWGNVYGITAPIGIALSRTFGKKLRSGKDTALTEDLIRNPDKVRIGNKNMWRRTQNTLTLAVNIVDIGAMVSYRFSHTTDSTGKGLPKDLHWAQVLSPGFKLSYGIRNTPLVISAGYQYTPLLRTVKPSDAEAAAQTFETRSTHRFFAALLFDLPLVNLWQRSYWRSNHKK